MLEQKAHHKELKRAVNEIENKRRNDRTFKSWFDLKTLKKIKLQAKDKLNEIKQKLQP
jgi:uncharacterized protein YdcH (DUF465 family)|tara:strand:- start:613 stop:786 length:174 start_codon:yes stop_codon:yes gene_type:complete